MTPEQLEALLPILQADDKAAFQAFVEAHPLALYETVFEGAHECIIHGAARFGAQKILNAAIDIQSGLIGLEGEAKSAALKAILKHNGLGGSRDQVLLGNVKGGKSLVAYAVYGHHDDMCLDLLTQLTAALKTDYLTLLHDIDFFKPNKSERKHWFSQETKLYTHLFNDHRKDLLQKIFQAQGDEREAVAQFCQKISPHPLLSALKEKNQPTDIAHYLLEQGAMNSLEPSDREKLLLAWSKDGRLDLLKPAIDNLSLALKQDYFPDMTQFAHHREGRLGQKMLRYAGIREYNDNHNLKTYLFIQNVPLNSLKGQYKRGKDALEPFIKHFKHDVKENDHDSVTLQLTRNKSLLWVTDCFMDACVSGDAEMISAMVQGFREGVDRKVFKDMHQHLDAQIRVHNHDVLNVQKISKSQKQRARHALALGYFLADVQDGNIPDPSETLQAKSVKAHVVGVSDLIALKEIVGSTAVSDLLTDLGVQKRLKKEARRDPAQTTRLIELLSDTQIKDHTQFLRHYVVGATELKTKLDKFKWSVSEGFRTKTVKEYKETHQDLGRKGLIFSSVYGKKDELAEDTQTPEATVVVKPKRP